jgi:O-antigen ligase
MDAKSTLSAPGSLSIARWTPWLPVSLVLGCVLALSGLPGLYACVALATLVVFGGVAARFPMQVMAASIWCLGLFPFNWGLTGMFPKLFFDECLLILYLLAFLPLYLLASREWQPGFGALYAVLATFVFLQLLSLVAGTDLIALRNLLETYALGALLLVVYLQEAASSSRHEWIGGAAVWVTVVLAALSVIERVTQRNPIMEQNTGIFYLSPQLAQITEGVYRPYVTFFHPSEAATFMALGVPFAVRRWRLQRSYASMFPLAVVAAGLLVNATRGVWFGVAVALILMARRPLLILLSAVPVAGIGAMAGYAVFGSTPFMQRLTDPNNLYSRFVYWSLGIKVFASHALIGVGHMQFKKVYLDYVHDLSNVTHFDIAKVSVVDNMYLTTLAEHGLLGFLSLAGLLIFLYVSLGRMGRKLLEVGMPAPASLVHCCQLALITYAATGCFADVNQFTKATKYLFILVGLGLGTGARYLGSPDLAGCAGDSPDTRLRLESVR